MERISIHALREEGDGLLHKGQPPCSNFYPRPPRGGRLTDVANAISALGISIHALREEGDGFYIMEQLGEGISIHALREEGDSKNRDKISIFL